MQYTKHGSYGCLCKNCDRALPAIPLRHYKTPPKFRLYTVRRKCQCCGLINLIDVDLGAKERFRYREGGYD